MKKLKLATIVGTRPELIKLSEVIKKADQTFEHSFVHTGQNYDVNLNEIFYEDLGLRKPDIYLNVPGRDLGQTMGNVIEKSYSYFVENTPDAVLVLGDTNSALSAISAKRLKIPIFHMEAGNRCFDENLPEETNRRIIDHISDVNLPYSEHARRNLLHEGLKTEYTFVTGSPMREVLEAQAEKIGKSKILSSLELGKKEYIILSAHREENIDNEKTFFSLIDAVNIMAEEYQIPVIYSVHPRSAKFIKERGFQFHSMVKQMLPFKFSDYVKLQANAFCVVSDSGTLAEESSICGFPAVSICTSTERPEAMEKGAFLIGGITEKTVLQAVAIVAGKKKAPEKVQDYMDKNISDKVIGLIQGYTEIINRNVWKKNIFT